MRACLSLSPLLSPPLPSFPSLPPPSSPLLPPATSPPDKTRILSTYPCRIRGRLSRLPAENAPLDPARRARWTCARLGPGRTRRGQEAGVIQLRAAREDARVVNCELAFVLDPEREASECADLGPFLAAQECPAVILVARALVYRQCAVPAAVRLVGTDGFRCMRKPGRVPSLVFGLLLLLPLCRAPATCQHSCRRSVQ